MKVELSVVIITFNEEQNIARCLDAVAGLSKDVVVVDSFSTDKTKEICEGYSTVNFIQTKWKGYSETKNFANRQAKYNYILSLDADEVVSGSLIESIKSIDKFLGVYEFNRLTNYCGKWIRYCGWYPDKKVRIFPKKDVHWVGEHVHETLFIPNSFLRTFLTGDLFHYSFSTIEEHYERIENYSTLQAQKMKKAGEKATFMKLIFAPMFKFFRDYVLKLGFLDGYYGYIVCKNSAKATALKYVKLRTLNNK